MTTVREQKHCSGGYEQSNKQIKAYGKILQEFLAVYVSF
jgi:hypothetical protein